MAAHRSLKPGQRCPKPRVRVRVLQLLLIGKLAQQVEHWVEAPGALVQF